MAQFMGSGEVRKQPVFVVLCDALARFAHAADIGRQSCNNTHAQLLLILDAFVTVNLCNQRKLTLPEVVRSISTFAGSLSRCRQYTHTYTYLQTHNSKSV